MQRLEIRLPIVMTAILLLALLALPAGAQAANVYVDQGSIGGKCSDTLPAAAVTASTPWCTPTRAISAAPEGATVLLRGGTYSNISALNVRRTEMLTLKAAPGETVTLGATSTTDLYQRAIYVKGSTNLRFEGFSIIGGAYVWNSSQVKLVHNDITGIGVRFRNIADGLVERNDFHDFTGEMRALDTTANVGESGAVRFVVRGNKFHAIEHDAVALYWRLKDVIVEDNYIHDIHRAVGSDLHPDALQIAPQSEGATGVIVRRNRIVDYDQGLLIKDGVTRGVVVENNVIGVPGFFAAFIFDAPNARITNNTFVDGHLYLRGGTTRATVTNNVIRRFAIEETASIAVSAHNLVDRTQYNPGYVHGPTDIPGQASFVNASQGNYRLTSGSVGIDDGSPGNGAPSHDHENNPRPSGAGYDIGAYEMQVPVSSPVIPPPCWRVKRALG